MKHYVFTAYRRKWLYLSVLCLLFVASGFGSVYMVGQDYESTARIWTDRSPLQGITGSPGYSAPAAHHQGALLSQLLQTDSFIVSVINGAGLGAQLTGSPQKDEKLIAAVREKLSITVNGDNTLSVAYRGPDPVQARDLVSATIVQLRSWNLEMGLEQSTAELRFYQGQLQTYKERMDEAKKALEDFIAKNKSVTPGSLAYLELQQLEQEYQRARDVYTAAATRLSERTAITGLPAGDRQFDLRVLDPPRVPTAPSRGLKSMLKYAMLGGGASFGFVVGLIVVAAWLDRTVRSAAAAGALTGLPVLVVLPQAKRSRWWRRRRTDTSPYHIPAATDPQLVPAREW